MPESVSAPGRGGERLTDALRDVPREWPSNPATGHNAKLRIFTIILSVGLCAAATRTH